MITAVENTTSDTQERRQRPQKLLNNDCMVGLERYQAQHPIPNTLASNDTNSQYPVPQYRYRSNPTVWGH